MGDTETITNANSVKKYDQGFLYQQGLSYLNEEELKKNKTKSTFFNNTQKEKANAKIILLIFFCANIL